MTDLPIVPSPHELAASILDTTAALAVQAGEELGCTEIVNEIANGKVAVSFRRYNGTATGVSLAPTESYPAVFAIMQAEANA